MNIEFKKFPSLENTYREKEIAKVEELGYHNEQYIVTEKVHGANFSFHVYETETGVEIKCAKRTGFIEEDEKFFNYRSVLEKYRNKLVSLRERCDFDFILYGELFGGNIQSGMCYSLEQDFVAFDMVSLETGIPFNKLHFIDFCNIAPIPTVPLIGVYDTLHEALNVSESFESKLIRDDFDGEDYHKETEGIVIEPVSPKWFMNKNRIYFKKKTKRFLEKGGNKIPKPKGELPKELESVLLKSFEYVTQPRFEAVVSKIGEVSIKDIGKVMGLMTKDILEDMEKDKIEIPESKKFMKLLQAQVQTFILPIILNM